MRLLGVSWAAPGSKTPPRRLLKASWAALGPSWEPLGGEYGSNKAPKMKPKSNKNLYKNLSNFDMEGYIFRCWWIVDAKMEWSQISIWIGKYRFL